MKKTVRTIAMLLAVVSLFCAIPLTASADLRTGGEIFDGVSRGQREQQMMQEIYDDLCRRAYWFDPDVALPGMEHLLPLNQISIKYIQAKRGVARGQSLYDRPNGTAQWYAKDGCKFKIYANYGDWSFVELMMSNTESEGTMAWVPTTYVVSNWSARVSEQRTEAAIRGY